MTVLLIITILLTVMHCCHGCSGKYFHHRPVSYKDNHSLKYGVTKPIEIMTNTETYAISYNNRYRGPNWAYERLEKVKSSSIASTRLPETNYALHKEFQTEISHYKDKKVLALAPLENHNKDDYHKKHLETLSNFVPGHKFTDNDVKVLKAINKYIQELSKMDTIHVCTLPLYYDTPNINKPNLDPPQQGGKHTVTIDVLEPSSGHSIYVPIKIVKAIYIALPNDKTKVEIFVVNAGKSKPISEAPIDTYKYTNSLEQLEFEAGFYIFEDEMNRRQSYRSSKKRKTPESRKPADTQPLKV